MLFLSGIVFIFLSNIFRVLQPQAIRNALDKIHEYIKSPASFNPNELSILLVKFGALVLLWAILMGFFMYLMRQTIIVMSRKIEYDMRKKLFNHYLSLDSHFFRSQKTGDLMSRMVEDVNKVRMYLGPVILYGINLISLFIVVISTMIGVNAKLSLYTLAPLPILSLIIYWVSNNIHLRSLKIQKQIAKLSSISQESFSGIRMIKSYRQENYWNNLMNEEAGVQKDLSLSLAKVDAMFFPSMFLLIGFSTLITIYVGGLNVFEGKISPGTIAEFVIYVNMLTWPVSAIGWCASLIQQAEASQKRINEFLEVNPQNTNPNQLDSIQEAHLELNHIQYSYPNSDKPVLIDFNLSLKQGESVAIVGETGAGKTSIADLLCGVIAPDSGAYRINGKNSGDCSKADFGKVFSYITQEVFLFSDSIKNNILFGNPSISENKLKKLVQLSCLQEEVDQMGLGIETVIGERGVSLSGGQKQRLSLARGMAKDSLVYIFDDIFSAVDEETELEMMKNVFAALNGKSLIFISHRLEVCKHVDQILVLKEGKIVEKGSFEELSNKKAEFSRLFNLQKL